MKAFVLLSGLMLFVSHAGLSQGTEGEKEPNKNLNKEITVTPEEEGVIKAYRVNSGVLEPSKTSVFRATVINTNFIVPIIRFNTVNDKVAVNNQKGNISLFNSVGAGVSLIMGRLELTTDKDSKIINRELDNTFGVQLGVLFAANAGSANDANIFAPTFSISALNFQVGMGYELGTVAATEDRLFYTVAYAIPFSKLIRGGFYVLRRTPTPVNPAQGFY